MGIKRSAHSLTFRSLPRAEPPIHRARREREILEHAVRTVTEQAAKADALVDEAIEVGHGRSNPLVTHATMLRLDCSR
jgi:hypothetical protein